MCLGTVTSAVMALVVLNADCQQRASDGGQPVLRELADDLYTAQMNANLCGRNCLYMLLRLYGRQVSYDEVAASLYIGPMGSNVLEMRDVAARYGLALQIYKSSIERFTGLGHPVIALMDRTTHNGSVHGHFVIVLGYERDKVWFLDGISPARYWYRRSEFERNWSGTFLEPVDQPMASTRSLVFAALLVWLAGGAIWLLARCSLRICCHMSVPFLLIISPLPVVARAESAQSPISREGHDGFYRIPANDGVNSLYVFLGCHGCPAEYPDLLAQLSQSDGTGVSLLKLRDVARAAGLETQVHKCRPNDLPSLPLPTLAYLDSPGGEAYGPGVFAGGFVLILGTIGQSFQVFRGADASLVLVSKDNFRRDWSGYVLVCTSDRDSACVSFILGAVAVALYGAWRGFSKRGLRNQTR